MNKPIYELHVNHTSWLSDLQFYKDEIDIMRAQLGMVASWNPSPENLARIEQIENQLIVQKEQIDILHHQVNEQEAALNESVKRNPVAVDHRKLPASLKLSSDMESFTRLFMDLRKELTLFLAASM